MPDQVTLSKMSERDLMCDKIDEFLYERTGSDLRHSLRKVCEYMHNRVAEHGHIGLANDMILHATEAKNRVLVDKIKTQST